LTNSIRRVARKAHRCDSCTGSIAPGHVYLVHTLFPGNDVWDNEVPMRLKECADCAGRYGRDLLLHPIPADQEWRYWLADDRPQPPDPLDGAA
jgi:hypothetical protein